jgi:hypothetical protein
MDASYLWVLGMYNIQHSLTICQTGGQDDLITIVSPSEQRVIARCQGHASFVSNVAFDHTQCDGRTYRSVDPSERGFD